MTNAPATPTPAAAEVGEACDWPVSYADCSGECAAYENWPAESRAEMQAAFEQMAADLLSAWTNGLFGVCPTVIRPCTSDCGGPNPSSTFWGRGPRFDPPFPRAGTGGFGTGSWVPILLNGAWSNLTCGCAGVCSCSMEGPTSLALPGPVQSVAGIRIDGVPLPPDAYRVASNRWLIRTDGGVWPACQNLLADASEEGTFEVTYLRGIPVPTGGQIAAGRLACELALAACNDGACALPARLQTITRQGITVGFMDTFEGLQDGHTGIWTIDAWIASVTRPKSTATVRSPDLPAPRRGY